MCAVIKDMLSIVAMFLNCFRFHTRIKFIRAFDHDLFLRLFLLYIVSLNHSTAHCLTGRICLAVCHTVISSI